MAEPSKTAIISSVAAGAVALSAVFADLNHEVKMGVYEADRITTAGLLRTVYGSNAAGDDSEFVLDKDGPSPVSVGECFRPTVTGYYLFKLAGYPTEKVESAACPG